MSEPVQSQEQQFLTFSQQLQTQMQQLYELLLQDQKKCFQLKEQHDQVLSRYHDVKRMRDEELENLLTLKHNKKIHLHNLYQKTQTNLQSKKLINQIALQDQLDYQMPQLNFDLGDIQPPKTLTKCLDTYKEDFLDAKDDLEQAITKLKIVILLADSQENSKTKKSQKSQFSNKTKN